MEEIKYFWTHFCSVCVKAEVINYDKSKDCYKIRVIEDLTNNYKKGKELILHTDTEITEDKYNSLKPKRK